MRETAQQHPDDFPAAFDRAFAALQVCVETACAAEAEWARGVAAGVRAALAFAAADPPSAWVLALASHAAGREGIDRYYRMLDYFGDLLAPGRELHPENGPLPAVTERAMIGGLASLIATRLQLDRAAELPELAPEAIQFVLTPYLDVAEARRIATGR